MVEIVTGFLQAVDGISVRHRAQAEAAELGKHEPHPVRRFSAGPELVDDLRVDVLLGSQETGEVETVFRNGWIAAVVVG